MKKGEELALSTASVLLEITVTGYNSTITLLHSDGLKLHRVLAHLSAIRLNRRKLCDFLFASLDKEVLTK